MAGTGPAALHAPGDALLRVEDLVVEFPVRDRSKVHAVSGVSFDVLPGETLGIVGESGCGKSTTAKAVMQLVRPTSGRVFFDGEDLTRLQGEPLRRIRSKMQMIFQDPISSLNPRRRIGDIVAEPLDVWGIGDAGSRREKVDEVLDAVGLDPVVAREKRPHEFSGGQCQRISIARALVIEPKLLICDEPVSALDVSVQAQILNLLEDLKERYGLTVIFIAHDLAVVKNVSDRVAVMYLGKMCEIGEAAKVYGSTQHPYADALLRSVPVPDPGVRPVKEPLGGDPPSPVDPPSGCRFRSRCPRMRARCAEEEPRLRELSRGQFVACHFPVRESPATGVGSQAS